MQSNDTWEAVLAEMRGNEFDDPAFNRADILAVSATGLHFSCPPRNKFFGTHRLAIALRAAAELGGADELFCGKTQLVLNGAGFWIAIMHLHDGGSNVFTVNVPDNENGGAK